MNPKCEDSYEKHGRFDTFAKHNASPNCPDLRPVKHAETIKQQKSLQLSPLDFNKSQSPHSPSAKEDNRLNSGGANTLMETEAPVQSIQPPLRNKVQIGKDSLEPVNIQNKIQETEQQLVEIR